MKKKLVCLFICLLFINVFTPKVFSATVKDLVKGFVQTKFEVEQGAKFTLPSKVKIQLRNGKQEIVSVKWDKYTNVINKAGKYTFSGLITKYNEKEKFIVNVIPSKKKVSQTSTVPKKEIIDYDYFEINNNLYVGDVVQLPSTVKVSYSDNSTGNEKITWYPADFGEISNNTFVPNKPGDFQIKYSINNMKGFYYKDIHVIQRITFENSALESSIKKYYYFLDEITSDNINCITTLSVDASDVSSLKDIDKLSSLEELYLYGTTYTDGKMVDMTKNWDISELYKLPKLKLLVFYSDDAIKISDVMNVNVYKLVLNCNSVLDNVNSLRNSTIKELDFAGVVRDCSAFTDVKTKMTITWDDKSLEEGIEINNRILQEVAQDEVRQKTQKEHDDQVNQKIKDVIANYIKSEMDDRTKIQAIHDYIVNNTEYDYDNFLAGTIPPESYTPYGVLILGKGVCSGYANTFNSFMQELGIECYLVSGEADGVGGRGGHAWNIVKVNGEYKNVDTTWDDPIYTRNGVREQVLRYDYFLISDEKISKDHYWDTTKYPKCN